MNKKDALYLLRIDCDCFIIDSDGLDNLLNSIREHRIIEVADIAKNYLRKQYTYETRLSYQELYHIKYIELKGNDYEKENKEIDT